MKKSIFLSLCLTLILCLSACGASLDIGEESDITVNRFPEYSLKIEEISLKESSMMLSVSNRDIWEIGSGNERDFFLEVSRGGKWHSIDAEEISNTSEIHTFFGDRNINVNWKNRYGNLPSGRYRVVKYFFFPSDDGSQGAEGFYLADEFEI